MVTSVKNVVQDLCRNVGDALVSMTPLSANVSLNSFLITTRKSFGMIATYVFEFIIEMLISLRSMAQGGTHIFGVVGVFRMLLELKLAN